jgi:predicted dehydrogenase/threonine dehydrogenase-like Zn-dependent dehydrogenase
MKQIFDKKGKIIIENVPAPDVSNEEILVQVYYSCISTGTEISGLKSSSKTLYKKAIEKPENIKKVLDMIKERGFSNAVEKVRERLDSKNPLGYSAAGVVIEVGKNVKDFKIGEKVACAGAGIANHSEFIAVPENLAVKVPLNLPIHAASTVAIGAIALQGLRRANVQIGEFVVVFGLGILGQITSQLLKLAGCKVIGIDLNQDRLDIATKHGLNIGINASKKSVVEEVIKHTDGLGADSVIITAASSEDSIINQSIELCRRKGKVIIVGDVVLNIRREEFYKKELDILMSTSYGPGRYDEKYELKNFEYPYAYIRWPERRNMQEYLDLISEEKLRVGDLIDKIYKIEEAESAYNYLKSDKKPLIVLLEYNKESIPEKKVIFNNFVLKKNIINVGLIGAGNFSREVHLPNLKKLSDLYKIYSICSKEGDVAAELSKKYEASYATTDYLEILKDKNIDLVIISTRHNLHVPIAIEAAKMGKAIFLEKPMALNEKELLRLIDVLDAHKVPFMVGFNRRFSYLISMVKELISNRINPLIINYQMNAGFIPRDNWMLTDEGGGRNIGEACHIYDLFNYLIDDRVSKINAFSINPKSEQYGYSDNFSVALKYQDGSVCNLIYTSLGSRISPKETMQIYFDGKVIDLNDYSEINIFNTVKKSVRGKIQDKGHLRELKTFGEYIRENKKDYPIPLWQLKQATEISFEVEKQLKEN